MLGKNAEDSADNGIIPWHHALASGSPLQSKASVQRVKDVAQPVFNIALQLEIQGTAMVFLKALCCIQYTALRREKPLQSTVYLKTWSHPTACTLAAGSSLGLVQP